MLSLTLWIFQACQMVMFIFWMKEGASGCGEDPDSTEHFVLSNIGLQIVNGRQLQPEDVRRTLVPLLLIQRLGTPGYSAEDVTYTLPTDAFGLDLNLDLDKRRRFRTMTIGGL